MENSVKPHDLNHAHFWPVSLPRRRVLRASAPATSPRLDRRRPGPLIKGLGCRTRLRAPGVRTICTVQRNASTSHGCTRRRQESLDRHDHIVPRATTVWSAIICCPPYAAIAAAACMTCCSRLSKPGSLVRRSCSRGITVERRGQMISKCAGAHDSTHSSSRRCGADCL